MTCLGTHVAVLFRDATPRSYAVAQYISDILDVTAADIMAWYTAALWWKSMLEKGRLPPAIVVDLSAYKDEWDIDKIWERGVCGVPTVEEIEANPLEWRL